MLVDTWWFIILAVASAALLIWAALRYRLATARRREQELRTLVDQRTQEIRSLASLTEKINTAVRLEEVLDHVWDSFRTVVPYNRIGFAEIDSEARTVSAVWARSDASEIMINAGYTVPIDSTSLGRILETGKPRIIGDLRRYLKIHPNSEATRAIVEEGMQSSLTVPLSALDREVGFLFFSCQEPQSYVTKHIRLLERISVQLSLAIGKSRLYERLLETTHLLEEANQRLEREASIDSLTGVSNRRVFDERLELEWRRCRRSRQPLSLLMIDIDHFKQFNDLHGHVVGDRCLRAVAKTMSKTTARAADLVARYGGEEFGAILPETNEKRAAHLAEELRRQIEEVRLHDLPASTRITISIGVATEIPQENGSAAGLVRRADESLYTAKSKGRNVVHSNSVPDTKSETF